MATRKITIQVPLNRVEGDLEIRAEVEDGRVAEAWCMGTMFRGIENLLVGRGARDGLVVTPRICGLCSLSHLSAAARALDAVAGAAPPPDALRIRNVTLMTEQVQSDMRQSFLMFAADFANAAYARHPLYEEAVRRYEPFKGETAVAVIQETRKVIEIIAILGGQWPHTSFIVPGGVSSMPGASDVRQCRFALQRFRDWYSRRVLGCSLERWSAVRGAEDLDGWLEECDAHRDGELGFFIRFARAAGLDKIGRGHANFLSYGSLEIPAGSAVSGLAGDGLLQPAGFIHGPATDAFNAEKITEQVAHSWYMDDTDGRHPAQGETRPYATGDESVKYSWTKAPRYEGRPAETGPLAEMLLAGSQPLTGLAARDGVSAFTRQLARILRPAALLPAMETWLDELSPEGPFYSTPGEIRDGTGCGLVQATRGALGHWLRIENGRIAHYQVVTPTAWNASPRDGGGVRGPIEEALIGVPVADPANPVELGHVVRSFDPCLVCSVHAVTRGRSAGRITGVGWR